MSGNTKLQFLFFPFIVTYVQVLRWWQKYDTYVQNHLEHNHLQEFDNVNCVYCYDCTSKKSKNIHK